MPHTLRMVSVGIDRYKYYPAAKLDFASSDAREIANAFRECTDLSLEIGSPYVLMNADATRRSIRDAMENIFRHRSSDTHSVAVFYFAGHGIATETPPRFYLCCHDINTTDVEVGSIRIEEIYDWLSDSSAEYAIAIIDACFSGGLLIEPIGPKMAAKVAYRNMIALEHPEGKALALHASCRSDQRARESRSLRHGLYTYHVLRGLRAGLAADLHGLITLDGLFTYVVRQFQGDEQEPQSKILGEQQQPLILKSGLPPSPAPLSIRKRVSASQPVPALTFGNGSTEFPRVSPRWIGGQSLRPPTWPPLPIDSRWEKLESMRSLIVVLLLAILIIVVVISSVFFLYPFFLMHWP